MTPRHLILSTLLLPTVILTGCHTSSYTKVGTVSSTPEAFEGVRNVDVRLNVADIRLQSGPWMAKADLLCRSELVDEVMPRQRFEEHVRMEVVDGELQIRPIHEDGDDWRFDLTLQVPDSSGIFIRNGVGDISGELGDLARLRLETGVGDVDLTVRSVTEKLSLDSGVGDLGLKIRDRVPAEMSVESGVGDVDVKLPDDASVSVRASNGIGDVSVRRAENPIGIPTSQLKIGAGTGDIRVR